MEKTEWTTWHGVPATLMGSIALSHAKELGLMGAYVYALPPSEYDLLDRHFDSRPVFYGLENQGTRPIYEEKHVITDQPELGSDRYPVYGTLYHLAGVAGQHVYCVRLRPYAIYDDDLFRSLEVAMFTITDHLDSLHCRPEYRVNDGHYRMTGQSEIFNRHDLWPLINHAVDASGIFTRLYHYYEPYSSEPYPYLDY